MKNPLIIGLFLLQSGLFEKTDLEKKSFDNLTELIFVSKCFYGLKMIKSKFPDFSSSAIIAFQKI